MCKKLSVAGLRVESQLKIVGKHGKKSAIFSISLKSLPHYKINENYVFIMDAKPCSNGNTVSQLDNVLYTSSYGP